MLQVAPRIDSQRLAWTRSAAPRHRSRRQTEMIRTQGLTPFDSRTSAKPSVPGLTMGGTDLRARIRVRVTARSAVKNTALRTRSPEDSSTVTIQFSSLASARRPTKCTTNAHGSPCEKKSVRFLVFRELLIALALAGVAAARKGQWFIKSLVIIVWRTKTSLPSSSTPTFKATSRRGVVSRPTATVVPPTPRSQIVSRRILWRAK